MTIRVREVAFSYEGVEALSGVTFEVEPGRFVGIIGPNGSGKTTLLRCIANVLTPKKGSVLIDDVDVKEMKRREIARSVGVVPQSAPMDFAFTVRDVVLMGRTPHLDRLSTESKDDIAIAEEAMRETGVSNLAERTFDEISGGERQRVVIARALTQSPRILLLDEPTLHLDISAQYQILDLVRRLNRHNGMTVISVFHDLSLASQYSDELILMNKGKVEAIGGPGRVLTPENVRRSYGIDILVERHPITGRLQVVPYASADPDATRRMSGRKVHIICGGGSGARAMQVLHEKGFVVSAGVLNILDTDHDCASMLAIAIVSEAPFSPISDKAHEENIKMIASAEGVLVTDFPIGPGNLRNLEAAEAATMVDVLVVLLMPEHGERDFTGGRASEILARLMKKAKIASNLDEAIGILTGKGH
jgi:iron complex transport system ATP-binding protein